MATRTYDIKKKIQKKGRKKARRRGKEKVHRLLFFIARAK
tara:strand:- start:986 stop:1105 length:120 start_codon:yes stop_codon:yes gene_type:complete